MNKNKTINYTYLIIGILILLSFIPLYVMSFYAHPCLDDWTYSLITHWQWDKSHNIFLLLYQSLREAWIMWNGWQGTYSSAFIMSLQPSIFGEEYYSITGIFYITLLIASTSFFFCYISRKVFKDKKQGTFLGIALGLICSFFSLQYMPSAVEGLYWFNGATHYSLFHAAILVFICAFIELQTTEKKTKYTAICSLMAIFIEGGNHMTAFLLWLFVIVAMAWMFINKKKQPLKNNLIVLGVGLLFFSINAFSPGNAIRKESYGEGLSFFEIIDNSRKEALRFVKNWTNIKTLIMMALIIPLVNEIVRNVNYNFKYPLELFVLSLLTIGVMITPVMFGQKDSGAGRNLNVYYYTFLILIILNEIYIIGYLREKNILNLEGSNYKFFPLLCTILFVGLIWTSLSEIKSYQACVELTNGTAEAHHNAYLDRINIAKENPGDEVVYEPLPDSQLLSTYDLSENSGEWPNTDYAAYHYLYSARISSEE